MKKKILLLLIIMLFAVNKVSAETAILTNQRVSVNGELTPLIPYTIKGTTYFKLRDIALAFNNTNIEFNVDYDESKKNVYIIPGRAGGST